METAACGVAKSHLAFPLWIEDSISMPSGKPEVEKEYRGYWVTDTGRKIFLPTITFQHVGHILEFKAQGFEPDTDEMTFTGKAKSMSTTDYEGAA